MKKGLTVIELISVVAIILIVVAISAPAVSRAREKSQEASSISNMRQLYVALELYRGDYETATYGSMEAMGLPDGPQRLGPSVAHLHPPKKRPGIQYMYLPIPEAEDRRSLTWKDYTLQENGRAVLLADIWFNFVPSDASSTYLFNPHVRKYVLGITLNGNIVRKTASGDLDLEWWQR
ncbi:MAG TPA: type II secretion system protein [Fimbriimonadaceae bacterium]|nr:type II secretion system protein [Fimbriimonadaceae bacterium]